MFDIYARSLCLGIDCYFFRELPPRDIDLLLFDFIFLWFSFFFLFIVKKVNTTAECWALLTLSNANLCCVFHSDITTFTLNYNDINEREDHNSNSHNDTNTKKNRLNRSTKTGFFSVVLTSVVWFLAILSMCRDSKSDYFSTFTYISVRIYIGYLFAMMMCSAKFMHTKSLDNVGHVKRTRIGAHTCTLYLYQVSKNKQKFENQQCCRRRCWCAEKMSVWQHLVNKSVV